MNSAQEINSSLVVTCCYCSILFQACKKVLNQMTGSVKVFIPLIENTRFFCIALRRDNSFLPRLLQEADNPFLSIVTLVRNYRFRPYCGQKLIRSCKIVSLTRRQ